MLCKQTDIYLSDSVPVITYIGDISLTSIPAGSQSFQSFFFFLPKRANKQICFCVEEATYHKICVLKHWKCERVKVVAWTTDTSPS